MQRQGIYLDPSPYLVNAMQACLITASKLSEARRDLADYTCTHFGRVRARPPETPPTQFQNILNLELLLHRGRVIP